MVNCRGAVLSLTWRCRRDSQSSEIEFRVNRATRESREMGFLSADQMAWLCRNRKSQFATLFLLTFLLAGWHISASATTGVRTCNRSASIRRTLLRRAGIGVLPVVVRNSVAGFECWSADSQNKQLPTDNDNSSTSPDSSSDIDDNDDGTLDDLSADSSFRAHHPTALLSVSDIDSALEHTPHGVLIPLLTVHCFYSLHEHIRERAPPR